MSRPPRNGEERVTLVEMLVALMICALTRVAGFGMPDTILQVNARAEGDLDRPADIDRTFLVLGRDLDAQAASLRLEDDVLSIGKQEGGTLRYDLEGTRLRRHPGASGEGQLLVGGIAGAD